MRPVFLPPLSTFIHVDGKDAGFFNSLRTMVNKVQQILELVHQMKIDLDKCDTMNYKKEAVAKWAVWEIEIQAKKVLKAFQDD